MFPFVLSIIRLYFFPEVGYIYTYHSNVTAHGSLPVNHVTPKGIKSVVLSCCYVLTFKNIIIDLARQFDRVTTKVVYSYTESSTKVEDSV